MLSVLFISAHLVISVGILCAAIPEDRARLMRLAGLLRRTSPERV